MTTPGPQDLKIDWDNALTLAETLVSSAEQWHAAVYQADETLDAVQLASEAKDLHIRAISLMDSAAALAVLGGASLRQVADALDIAPNSLARRLAGTKELGAYAEDGRVRDDGMSRARWDAKHGGLARGAFDPVERRRRKHAQ